AVGAQPAFARQPSVAEAGGDPLAPLAGDPALHGDAEAALAPPRDALAKAPPGDLAQDGFQLTSVQAHGERQAGGKLPESGVKKGRARLDRMMHRRAVYLRQVFAG